MDASRVTVRRLVATVYYSAVLIALGVYVWTQVPEEGLRVIVVVLAVGSCVGLLSYQVWAVNRLRESRRGGTRQKDQQL